MLKASDCNSQKFVSDNANMKAKATLITLILGLASFVITGCQTKVAIDPNTGESQTATYQAGYFRGPLDSTDLGQTFRTTIRVMDEMGYYRTGERHGDTSVQIYARKVGDQKVNVRLKQVTGTEEEPGDYIQVRIRIGTAGNLAESQAIYARLRAAI